MKLTGKKCQCVVCGEVFSTERNFDAHRRGPYEVGGRYCLDPKDAGLVPRCTKNGTYWVSPISNADWIK